MRFYKRHNAKTKTKAKAKAKASINVPDKQQLTDAAATTGFGSASPQVVA